MKSPSKHHQINEIRQDQSQSVAGSPAETCPLQRRTTGVILAGGESRRMGSDKSLLPIHGERFIDHVHARMSALFDEVIIVTNTPERYREIPCRKVPDLYPAQGALAGIHSGLVHAQQQQIFVVGCDMPFISAPLVERICAQADDGDLIIPQSCNGQEPLHALYNKRCLPAMERVLDAGFKRIRLFFAQVRVVALPQHISKALDPDERSFLNINTPEDYYRLRGSFTQLNDRSVDRRHGRTTPLSLIKKEP